VEANLHFDTFVILSISRSAGRRFVRGRFLFYVKFHALHAVSAEMPCLAKWCTELANCPSMIFPSRHHAVLVSIHSITHDVRWISIEAVPASVAETFMEPGTSSLVSSNLDSTASAS